MRLGGWYERREFRDQLDGFKNDVRGPVAPGVLETIRQAAGGELGKPVVGKGWTSYVSAKPFQPTPVVGGDRDVSVEAEAGDAGTAGAGQDLSIISIDPVSARADSLPGVGTGRDSTQDRRAVKIGQQRLILRERVGLFGITLRAQAATLEQGWNPASEIPS